MQGAARRGLPGGAGELESGDDHDRPGDGRRHLHRADHLAGRGAHHRKGKAGRAAADDGRADRAQLRARPRARGGAGKVGRGADRRLARGDRQGRGSREVQAGDEEDRPRLAALVARALDGGGAAGPSRDWFSCRNKTLLHPRRHRGRHRVQPRGIRRDLRARLRGLADQGAPDRGVGARLERVRDGGGARPQGQLHHRLLDREPRSDGRAYRRFDHRRTGADAHRQGIPDHARRLDRGAARDRRRHRRLERAVRGQPCRWPHADHRDEPARLALLRPGVEGHRLPDRQGRGEARGRLHARRDRQRGDRRRDAGVLRADHRLRGHQGAALRVREVPAGERPPHHADEVGGRGDGDRPHLPGVVPEGAARARSGRGRTEPAHARPRDAREGTRRARPGAHLVRRRRVRERLHAGRGAPADEDRPLVPRPDPANRRAGDGAGRQEIG